MQKHKTSLLMFAGAILFYVIFGILVPGVFYGSPEARTSGAAHAMATLSQFLRQGSVYVALLLRTYALARLMKELRD